MSTSSVTGKLFCFECGRERNAVRCKGCLQVFCDTHFAKHRQVLSQKLDEIESAGDMLRYACCLQINDLGKHPLIKQIEDWKAESIEKIEQLAEESKKSLVQHITSRTQQ